MKGSNFTPARARALAQIFSFDYKDETSRI